MTMGRRSSWILAAGLALALGVILAFLYVRTRNHDASSYFEDVVVLRQLKQLDARWELDVLKSKMGLNTNYDALVDPLVDLNQLREKFATDVARHQASPASELPHLIEAFHTALEEKTRLIEHFKSHNSVLRNSLAFLPTAAGDIHQAVRQDGGPSAELKHLSADVNEVLLNSMVFSQAPSQEKAADIQAELDRLSAAKQRESSGVRDSLNIFAAHVRTVLREQPDVNALLNDIAAVPTGARIEALDNALAREERESELQTQQYRKDLLIFATALVALFLYAAISLIRSHAVINRVNRELHGANATLEERVQERTRELNEAQNELLTRAREAGMAEVATNVLHNVGNVLNSVNVSAELIAAQVQTSRAADLARVVMLLSGHEDDLARFITEDAQGKHLTAYLSSLSEHLRTEQAATVKELACLRANIAHITEIVLTQQRYAKLVGVLEIVNVVDLVEDSLRLNAGAFARHRIEVVRDFQQSPPLNIDKHKVLQILINLVRNAKYACEESQRADRQLTVRVTCTQEHAAISVIDNGIGIASENLTRIFNHGFTTRAEGHGFGLHSGALAARELGGSLSVHSDGLGKGATFILRIPVRREDRSAPDAFEASRCRA